MSKRETQTFTSTRFGELTVAGEDIIFFPKGILGFEECRRYCVISSPDYAPFAHLQSLDEPNLAFVVVNPLLFFPQYRVEVDPREVAELEADSASDIVTWGIVTIPEDYRRMSVNLQGPILLNEKNRRAKQVVLAHSAYGTCHYIAETLEETEAQPVGEKAAAGV
ncbi:MAG TPA: flagellar assembly protein FliW [candidate division Zixibacteria bacterium]|nr:flagellar assembly protein FliW [candidate division Zixibacteria bacterium]